jgi:Tfp pilus assembly protein PilF
MLGMERGDLAVAEKRIERAIGIDQHFILAHYNLGVLYQKKNDNARAEKAFTSAIALDPAHFTAYYNRALVQLAQGKDRDAITSLELFIKHCPPTLVQPLADARSRLADLKKNRLH